MLIIDRIIEGAAVCVLNGEVIEIPVSTIDGQVKEGAVLIPNAAGDRYLVDFEETESRRAELTERFNRLKRK